MLEEGIKLWSCGKQRNIELLLSTLQDVRLTDLQHGLYTKYDTYNKLST